MKVYIVTSIELGWDCIIGVYGSLESLRGILSPEDDWNDEGLSKDSPYYNASILELQCLISGGPYVIHEKELEE